MANFYNKKTGVKLDNPFVEDGKSKAYVVLDGGVHKVTNGWPSIGSEPAPDVVTRKPTKPRSKSTTKKGKNK